METLIEKAGNVHILHLRGRLDLTASAEFGKLLEEIINGGSNQIVMECRDLQYVSSSGLGAFISAAKKLGQDGRLVFVELNSTVQNVFELTGIASLFAIYRSKEDGLQFLSGE